MAFQPAELSIVIPTFNERGNLPELIRRIAVALGDIRWEAIIVDDDSPDGTALQARQMYLEDPRVRCIHRLGRRGLSSACIEGMLTSSARFLAVMDADLQHDPSVLRTMYELLAADEADLVIGSRYTSGGSVGQWDGRRLAISRLATRLSNLVTKRPVADTMSGFFSLKRQVFDGCAKNLSSLGFKILLDIIASCKDDVRITEVPYTFGARLSGESKLSTNVAWEFLLLLADKMVGKYLPVRFLAFAFIGMLGVGVHFLALTFMFKVLKAPFPASQATATAAAILFNFSLNNVLTYAGRSLEGASWFRGLLTFYLICGIGAVANVGVSSYLFVHDTYWPIAALAGILLSVVWNYAVSARYTWNTA
jgi:dolichol-phosphate mannosyltransferase